jgi:hypothetical protein
MGVAAPADTSAKQWCPVGAYFPRIQSICKASRTANYADLRAWNVQRIRKKATRVAAAKTAGSRRNTIIARRRCSTGYSVSIYRYAICGAALSLLGTDMPAGPERTLWRRVEGSIGIRPELPACS